MELKELGWEQQKLVKAMAPEEQRAVLWDGWPPMAPYKTRLKCARLVWNLKESGPLTDPNLKAMAEGYDLTRTGLSQMLAKLAGIHYERNAAYPTLLDRVTYGRRTRRLAVRDGVELPPNPFPDPPLEDARDRRQAVTQSAVSALEARMAGVEVSAPPPDEDELPDELSASDKAIMIMRLAGEIFRDVDGASAAGTPVADESFVTAMRAKLEDLQAQLDTERRLRREAEESAVAHKKSYEALRRTNSRLDENLRAILNGKPAPDNRDARMFRQLMQERPS